jgi:hypothetical protein
MWIRALTLALLATGGACRGEGPAEAFLKFAEALSERDAEAAWAALASESRRQIEEQAAELERLSGGTSRRDPRELLLATALHAKRSKRAVTVGKAEGERAVLKVGLEAGGEDEVTMVREEGKWRVALPKPPP